jgi:RNA polymerase sigma-70 factor (ECF subfamily)
MIALNHSFRTDDATLTRACAAGDVGALGALYDRYAPMALRIAYRVTGSSDDAEDVVQDVFVGLSRALRHYTHQGEFSGWLRTVCVTTALMRLRRKRLELGVELERIPARPSSVPEKIDISRALAKLPPDLRVAFVLKESEGLSHEEIGATLGISKALSKVRVFRARKLLQRLLIDR